MPGADLILLRDDQLDERRAAVAAGGPLAPLYASLEMELRRLADRALYVPGQKAELSRVGGRCERDGTTLAFDPWSPREHRCPQCGAVYSDEAHHRAWITHYQLWLAERAVHAALFHALRGGEHHATLAREILARLSEAYLQYPNRDNVLGPSRPFFSTYLESIWLLQVCIATDLLRAAGDDGIVGRVADRIVEPSRRLIAEHDEGMSNRQVWNNAALMAAAALLGDERGLTGTIHASSGLEAHLARGLLSDGSWYEGENYHLFALRGLWYGVVMCDARRVPLPSALEDRFQRAFEFPFLTALPDFTMPSRKDSQYAVSLRQWRIAELAELGFARRATAPLGAALRRCYEATGERRDGGRSRSTADAERNATASRLTRADLGWRALLHARAELPPLAELHPRSVLLEGQGVAIFRRDGNAYAAMDYGQSGGGHGHPDRLNLLLAVGATRWLDDLGTGSYVDPSLHWFRSTLAHNAPLVNGVSQAPVSGTLTAHEERGALGWVEAAIELAEVTLTRTLVVATDYIISVLRWSAPISCTIELPWHVDGYARGITWSPSELRGGGGLEDGFGFVSDVRRGVLGAGQAARIESARDGGHATLDVTAGVDTELYAAAAPGQPPTTLRRFHVVRANGQTGEMRAVLAWGTPPRVEFLPERIVVHVSADERHEHLRVPGGWRTELVAGSSRSSIELGGRRAAGLPRPQAPPARTAQPVRIVASIPEWLTDASAGDRAALVVRELGRAHYRRSEQSWEEAGAPAATVAIGATRAGIHVLIESRAGDPIFAPADARNPYDNEHPDTMAAGAQVHFLSAGASHGWMFVPEPQAPRVRSRPLVAGDAPLEAAWRATPGGHEMRIVVPMPLVRESAFGLDVLVNETVAGRVRRRGQLVLSGAAGEFVYLRGDRQDPDRLLSFVLVP